MPAAPQVYDEQPDQSQVISNLINQILRSQYGQGQGGGSSGGFPGLANLFGGGGSSGGASSADSGAGSSGVSNFALPALYAALIGIGKNTEAKDPDTALGKGLLATLGPSLSQVLKDPVGMGLPTLLGLPFLTPFTSSKSSQSTKPEWSKLFGLSL